MRGQPPAIDATGVPGKKARPQHDQSPVGSEARFVTLGRFVSSSQGEKVIKRCLLMLCMGISGVAAAREPVDLDMVNRIRQEAFHRSQVMETFSHLTETIGPRLTNSPQMARANAWTRD
jgi:hypothetical protein